MGVNCVTWPRSRRRLAERFSRYPPIHSVEQRWIEFTTFTRWDFGFICKAKCLIFFAHSGILQSTSQHHIWLNSASGMEAELCNETSQPGLLPQDLQDQMPLVFIVATAGQCCLRILRIRYKCRQILILDQQTLSHSSTRRWRTYFATLSFRFHVRLNPNAVIESPLCNLLSTRGLPLAVRTLARRVIVHSEYVVLKRTLFLLLCQGGAMWLLLFVVRSFCLSVCEQDYCRK